MSCTDHLKIAASCIPMTILNLVFASIHDMPETSQGCPLRKVSWMTSDGVSFCSSPLPTIPFLQWFVKRTWTALLWLCMEKRSTASHATGRSMDQKAMDSDKEQEPWVWTREKDWESNLLSELEFFHLFLHLVMKRVCFLCSVKDLLSHSPKRQTPPRKAPRISYIHSILIIRYV